MVGEGMGDGLVSRQIRGASRHGVQGKSPLTVMPMELRLVGPGRLHVEYSCRGGVGMVCIKVNTEDGEVGLDVGEVSALRVRLKDPTTVAC
jgi:hypothetical protein